MKATYDVVRDGAEKLTEVRLPRGQFRRSYARLAVINVADKRAWPIPFWHD